MNPGTTKNNITKKRDKVNQILFDFAASRPYSLIVMLGLLCTLTVKLHYAIKNSRVSLYPGWILSDIVFFLCLDVILVILCFYKPKRWIIRIATIFAAAICIWSFFNAGWIIRTGTQILPRVLLSVFRDPLNSCRMVGRNLYKMPVTAVLLLSPGLLAFSFFVYVLVRPRFANYNSKLLVIRISMSFIICLLALVIRPLYVSNSSPEAISVELQYNAQIKAVTSLVRRNVRPPSDPTRRVPFYDQLELEVKDAKKQNIILIVLEGVQYEQTSLSGHSGDLTPFLADFAKGGVCFSNTRSTLTHTTKALFTLLTGRFASASQDIVETVPVKKPYASLATILGKQLGYRTAFFQSARGNFECRPGLVYNLGFDKFWARDDLNDPNAFLGYLACDEFEMIKPITKWIKQDNNPFLVTVMCSATHDPYEVPEWFAVQEKEELDRYRQTINYTDKFLSEFYHELTRIDLLDNTIFCIIGDHGEAFNEHGRSGHERIAFDEALHVPFCIQAKSLIEPGKIVSQPVSSIDLTPTLLGLLGINTQKAGFDGMNVLGSFDVNRKLYFSNWMYESQAGYIKNNVKYIYDPIHQTTCYYDLNKDPYELESIEIFEQEKQNLIEDIETWRENTIFQFDQDYKGEKLLYDRWFCDWSNRNARADFLTLEEKSEFMNK